MTLLRLPRGVSKTRTRGRGRVRGRGLLFFFFSFNFCFFLPFFLLFCFVLFCFVLFCCLFLYDNADVILKSSDSSDVESHGKKTCNNNLMADLT